MIDIVWDPKGHGPQNKSITVRSNSKVAPIQQLTIRALIEPFLKVSPPRADFGLVKRGSDPELILTVACQDPELEILEVKATTPDLQVSVLEPARNGMGKLRAVIRENRVTEGVRRFFPKILVTAKARVNGQGDPIEHTHEVPVMATLYDELAPDPAMFPIGRVLPGQTARKAITLSRPSGEAFSISKAALVGFQPSEGVTIDYAPQGNAYRLTLTVTPGAYTGPIRGKVRITSDVVGEESLLLEAYGVAGQPNK